MGLPFKKLASDLLRLEINTIVTENLSGTKPNNFRRLLYELAEEYRLRIGKYEAMFDNRPEPLSNEEVPNFQKYTGGKEAYQELAAKAHVLWEGFQVKMEGMPEKSEERERTKSRQLLAGRIFEQSNMIVDIFRELRAAAEKYKKEQASNGQTADDDFPNKVWDNDFVPDQLKRQQDYELSPDQMAVIRKAYEIGTQYILMQTVVQIEGDITTYITTKFLEMPIAEQEVIMKIHDTALNTSIRLWQYMFQTIGNLLGSFTGGIFAKKQPSGGSSGGFLSRFFGKK
jgi:hypothetical protein